MNANGISPLERNDANHAGSPTPTCAKVTSAKVSSANV